MKQQLPYAKELDDPAHGDVQLRLNGDSCFYVHRFLLKASSPVFAAMLTNGMRETGSLTIDITEEPDHAHAFGQLLTFLYPYSHVDITDDNVASLLFFSDKYQLAPKLKQECELYLITQRQSWDLLLMAQQYGLHRLLDQHVEWAAFRTTGLFRKEPQRLDQLKKSTLKKILLQRG
jgi:hypothetical protein